MKLCRSCHDGHITVGEGHPSDITPTAALQRAMSPEFPLQNGMLTCLSCHDIASRCVPDPATNAPAPFFLRGGMEAVTPDYCFRCHTRESYQPYNAHVQIEAGRTREEVCLWCHVGNPDRSGGLPADASYNLRSSPFGVCINCHSMGPRHPVEGQHMGMAPSPEMRSFMAAYEIQYRMNMPFTALLESVIASGRTPRQFPLDEHGQITCYSCHNAHEKDLLPATSPLSVGAEPDKASNHRLRVRQGVICSACHNK